jgi:hypothetical protein
VIVLVMNMDLAYVFAGLSVTSLFMLFLLNGFSSVVRRSGGLKVSVACVC